MNRTFSMDETYLQKTYAGWLGKIIGIRLGSPIEGWSYEKIRETWGEITGYLLDYRDYAADDDSNGPLFFARALLDFPAGGITEKEMAHTWLNYVPEHHGFFWWGGYGISTEHTAYDNLKNGMEAPLSGSMIQNGAACSEQIGGQIFSDAWGFIAPGNPGEAASLAEKMARVSHDGEAVYGGMFIAACVSAAYTASSIREVMEAGLSVIPAESGYARLCREVTAFYDGDEEKNWRKCMQFLLENYGYDKYPGNCHIIPNAGVVFLSLLYGEGNFTRTQLICNMCGWDTDCNAGNAGSILGDFCGQEGIEGSWIEPINDLLVSSSVLGGLNIDTISSTALLFCRIAYSRAGEKIPEKWAERMTTRDRVIHFDLEKSTGSIRTVCSETDRICRTVNSGVRQWEGHRSLHLSSKEMKKESVVRAFIKTYYRPEDLHDSRYDPAFTPVVFPGQVMGCRICSTGSFPLEASLQVWDSNGNREYLSAPVIIGEEWSFLEYRIPPLEGALIREAGVVLKPAAQVPADLSGDMDVFFSEFRWSGEPDYTIDFAREQVEFFGYDRGTLHREISQFTYLNGLWELDGPWLSGSGHREGECYTGLYSSEDYEVSCTLLPLKGHHHLVNFRVQGAARSYAFGFYGEGRLGLLKKNIRYSLLEASDYAWESGREYRIKIAVKADTVSLFLNGEFQFSFTDDSPSPYLYGQIGFTVLDGSHCHYRNLIFQGM